MSESRLDRIEDQERARATLAQFRSELLKLPGCTGVAIGEKQVRGEGTGQIAIVVFVKEKMTRVADEHRVPPALNGVTTDVVQRDDLAIQLIATDPFARFQEMICGISVTPQAVPAHWGTIGLFLEIEQRDYLLTCQHVLQAVNHNRTIIQPSVRDGGPPPADYDCGDYTIGYKDPRHDCAISIVGDGRTCINEVPNYPLRPGNRTIKGVGKAAVGDAVYKYGATSKFTEGTVRYLDVSHRDGSFLDAIEIEGDDVWVAAGDSGSVTIRQSDDIAIGLNFAGITGSTIINPPDLPAYPAFKSGVAFDLASQINKVVAGVSDSWKLL